MLTLQIGNKFINTKYFNFFLPLRALNFLKMYEIVPCAQKCIWSNLVQAQDNAKSLQVALFCYNIFTLDINLPISNHKLRKFPTMDKTIWNNAKKFGVKCINANESLTDVVLTNANIKLLEILIAGPIPSLFSLRINILFLQ